MRRRQVRSPQNHALVASVAGVILLCGVVSVQTTQASQAFSHEQGMARMAAPQGSDAGATTAGDATWWSFWRAVRKLPHAYDAATATVLGAEVDFLYLTLSISIVPLGVWRIGAA